MFRLIFRLISFVVGIIAGLWLALMVLPLPGTTIFNKMSKLPANLKKLLDDSIDLFGACFNFALAIGKDLNQQFIRISANIQERIRKVDEKLSEDASLEEAGLTIPEKKVEVINGYRS